jgi:hypothetical protein
MFVEWIVLAMTTKVLAVDLEVDTDVGVMGNTVS